MLLPRGAPCIAGEARIAVPKGSGLASETSDAPFRKGNQDFAGDEMRGFTVFNF